MKILLAIPSARFVSVQCFSALFPCVISYIGKVKHITFGMYVPTGYRIDFSRNEIVNHAKQEGYDYIFWVDDDVIVPYDALIKLIEADVDIVSGMYPYKLLPVKNIVAKQFNHNNYEDIKIDSVLNKNGLIQVDGFGFGCVLTKVSIFDKIKKPYFQFTDDMGEDIYCCKKLQKSGIKLWLHTDVLCSHIGQLEYKIEGKV